ncbi:hypothetical protein H2198_010760 [Neophaeococcomyces mojaviensis]|uniref:Uncharacterized protein n=1 Tax=Neophaeococcomyces mojaviensis TaxID=3383035 RepID=A0ACC2ZQX1_9EURO|nr:hypothetical protein H2198_010760 [Knufia sp. JES_112]
MAPSVRNSTASVRPGTRETTRPGSRDQAGVVNGAVRSRTSSLHSRIIQPMPSATTTGKRPRPKTLTYAYLVCGLGREPSQWIKAASPVQGKIQHMRGAVDQFWLPEILGSSPRLESDNEIARSLHGAMRQDSSHTLYGIALRVWSRADEERVETIRDLRRKAEPDYRDAADETYWIPYCLSFLSRYPLHNLLGDYLRGMWIHWNKATNLFHAEEVSRILSFPAPRQNELVRIHMKDYALCYRFPSSPTGFQNFALWPVFSCLSISNVVGLIEAAVSPTGRIILMSHHPAMLTVAAETIRLCTQVYNWTGLYMPVVHARSVQGLVQEPGPYILGVTTECRSLFTPPRDALLVDLDHNLVSTDHPPNVLATSQRTKMIRRLTQALNSDVQITGVPQHLKSAYGGGKLIPASDIIVLRGGEVERVTDPIWWNQDAVMAVMDHVCEKLNRSSGVKAIFQGSSNKRSMTKISVRHMNEMVRERNQYSRNALEAWQDFINLKDRMDGELAKVVKRNNILESEAEMWKIEFQKFQVFVESLNRELAELRAKIQADKREQRRFAGIVDHQKDDQARLARRLFSTERQRDNALEALVLQQGIAEGLEKEQDRSRKEVAALQCANATLVQQRDQTQRVVLHLQSLISGQAHHLGHILRSIGSSHELAEHVRQGFHDADEEDSALSATEDNGKRSGPSLRRAASAASFGGRDGLNGRLSNRASKRYSTRSAHDGTDKHLREKTDAIVEIIHNIGEQCAAAVESLELANEAVDIARTREARTEDAVSNANLSADERPASDMLRGVSCGDGHVTPASDRSSVPPTPKLVHQWSSTALSMASTAPTTYSTHNSIRESPAKVKIVIGGSINSSHDDGGMVHDFPWFKMAYDDVNKI